MFSFQEVVFVLLLEQKFEDLALFTDRTNNNALLKLIFSIYFVSVILANLCHLKSYPNSYLRCDDPHNNFLFLIIIIIIII